MAYASFPPGISAGNSAFQRGTFDARSVWLAPTNAAAVVLVDVASGAMRALGFWPPSVAPSVGSSLFQGAVFDGDAAAVVRVEVRSGRVSAFNAWPAGTGRRL
jgi:hypothetical protein